MYIGNFYRNIFRAPIHIEIIIIFELMETQIIQLKGAAIYQGDKLILQDIDFDLARGEFAYLVGKTGSGKTSLLKTLYGILPLKEGTGSIVGFDITDLNRKTLPLLRRKVGFIFQDFILLDDRTVNENLIFALKATGWKDEHQMHLKMDEVLIRVGLRAVGHKMPHQLSGGEQQRVVIARALLNSPALIIADEATGNLDPETSASILLLLKTLSQDQNTSVLFATHDYHLMKRFPARTVCCEQAKLVDQMLSSL